MIRSCSSTESYFSLKTCQTSMLVLTCDNSKQQNVIRVTHSRKRHPKRFRTVAYCKNPSKYLNWNLQKMSFFRRISSDIFNF